MKPEDVKIYKKFNFKTSKKELRHKIFPFVNPVPSEMKSLRLDDLCSVGIQWKMLTSLRPKSKLDEEYYSKCVILFYISFFQYNTVCIEIHFSKDSFGTLLWWGSMCHLQVLLASRFAQVLYPILSGSSCEISQNCIHLPKMLALTSDQRKSYLPVTRMIST